jgi:uncharacterized protein with GYD domain
MPKFMFEASYSPEGTKGLLKEGGSSRKAVVAKMIEGLGGSLESFYYAMGSNDLYVIANFPDTISAATLSLTVNSTGTVQVRTIPLMSPEEIDQASQRPIDYRAPGS